LPIREHAVEMKQCMWDELSYIRKGGTPINHTTI